MDGNEQILEQSTVRSDIVAVSHTYEEIQKALSPLFRRKKSVRTRFAKRSKFREKRFIPGVRLTPKSLWRDSALTGSVD